MSSSDMVYKECLKNHAASLGGTATDGCGEFMPSGEGESHDALYCSACGCHRNFHRKVVDNGGGSLAPCNISKCPYRVPQCQNNKGVLITARRRPHFLPSMGPPLPLESDDKLMEDQGEGKTAEVMEMGQQKVQGMIKKRYRTKFTEEQKEKMLEFAKKAEWKIQKLDEELIHQFCEEVGIKRRVLKVWMHNNKPHIAKTNINSLANDHKSNSNSSNS